MINEQLKSACHNAPVLVREDPYGEGTCYHECTCCGRDCNIMKLERKYKDRYSDNEVRELCNQRNVDYEEFENYIRGHTFILLEIGDENAYIYGFLVKQFFERK